ncbi:MAG: MBL fold metallo-hydrolase, partial [Halobacteria archaeon]|nr:MBL fold metallo-hydrolase [Halobacteria archaeon]
MARETAGDGVDTQEVADGIYMVDTLMLGHEGHTATFIVTDEDETAVVETGLSNGVDRILGGLSSLGIAPEEVDYVFVTHAHLDHAGGAGYLADECGNATLVCHERAVEYLSEPDKVEKLVESVRRAVGELGDDYGDAKPVDRERFETVSGGETLDVAGHSFEVVEATGHAPHQFCVYDG